MNEIVQFISQPWHWAISGAALASLVFSMTYLGRRFGISSSFEIICTRFGASRFNEYFDRDLSEDIWRFFFVGGAIIGGYIASNYFMSPEPVAISESTKSHLADWGISVTEGNGFLPDFFNLKNPKAVMLALIGGMFIGFGARYGKGCTSGHAITGLSHLKLQSLITVVGFFVGGLIMTWFIMPLIFAQ